MQGHIVLLPRLAAAPLRTATEPLSVCAALQGNPRRQSQGAALAHTACSQLPPGLAAVRRPARRDRPRCARARQVLLFAEVFSAKVLPHVYGLLRAGTPEALAQGEACLTAGLSARPRPRATWVRVRVRVRLPPLVLPLHATLACGPGPPAACARGARVGRPWSEGGAAARRQTLDAFLRRHGSEEGGGYLLGGRYSFAETSASPFVLRMLVVLPHYRGFDAAAVARERGLDRLSAWLKVRPTVMLAHALSRPRRAHAF